MNSAEDSVGEVGLRLGALTAGGLRLMNAEGMVDEGGLRSAA